MADVIHALYCWECGMPTRHRTPVEVLEADERNNPITIATGASRCSDCGGEYTMRPTLKQRVRVVRRAAREEIL